MKRLLNTLFVTTQGAYLARKGDTVLVRVEKETKLRVPISTLGSIVGFGRIGCSPALLDLCGRNGVAFSLMTESGRFIARFQGPQSGNVLLRRQQYRASDVQEHSARIARAVVIGKVANDRTVLLRAAREGQSEPLTRELSKAADELGDIVAQLQQPAELDVVRGREGDAARVYFAVFDHLISAQKENFVFRTRTRRPPLDAVNSLLSFLYAMLAHDVAAALEGVGLDPQVGFLHRDRPGRPGLALDLMEEFRAVMADRVALSLINRRQVKASGFRKTETGAVFMDDATRKEVLIAYQTRKQEELHHPYINEKAPIGLLPHVQAMLMARHMRGELNGYPPFLWK
jgi:CRISPR-associated protein Cas1